MLAKAACQTGSTLFGRETLDVDHGAAFGLTASIMQDGLRHQKKKPPPPPPPIDMTLPGAAAAMLRSRMGSCLPPRRRVASARSSRLYIDLDGLALSCNITRIIRPEAVPRHGTRARRALRLGRCGRRRRMQILRRIDSLPPQLSAACRINPRRRVPFSMSPPYPAASADCSTETPTGRL